MQQAIVSTLLIGSAVILALVMLLHGLVWISGARRQPNRLRRLAGDEDGSVQSLSFVLTLPLFIMVMMGIVQASQIMIAQVVVEYSAITTARSAVVWIPAHLGDGSTEGRNRVGKLLLKEEAQQGTTYDIVPDSGLGPKLSRIKLAAVQACMAIAPSRGTGTKMNEVAGEAHAALLKAYERLVPSAEGDKAVARRLRNKLAYSLAHTRIELRVFHPNGEPPLQQTYVHVDQYDRIYVIGMGNAAEGGVPDPIYHDDFIEDSVEFQLNELGWQDEVTVVVHHDLALLPGPGRMLARYVKSDSGEPDEISQTIQQDENLYTWPLSATATMSLEGQKSIIRYDHHISGQPY